jgi:8-oxo-dGTP pyrophosphatase MutT (NUDIX family)
MLRTHKNEVCFPGGKVDRGVDRNIVNTAVREVGEEIGIQTSDIDGESHIKLIVQLSSVHAFYCYVSVPVYVCSFRCCRGVCGSFHQQ